MRAWPKGQRRAARVGFARVGVVMWFRTSRFRHVVSHESVSHKHRARRPSTASFEDRTEESLFLVTLRQSPLCAVDARRTSVSVTPRGHRRVARPDETSRRPPTRRARRARAADAPGHGARGARTARPPPPLNGVCDAISDRFVRCVGRETRDPAAASHVRWAHRVRVVSYYRTYALMIARCRGPNPLPLPCTQSRLIRSQYQRRCVSGYRTMPVVRPGDTRGTPNPTSTVTLGHSGASRERARGSSRRWCEGVSARQARAGRLGATRARPSSAHPRQRAQRPRSGASS